MRNIVVAAIITAVVLVAGYFYAVGGPAVPPASSSLVPSNATSGGENDFSGREFLRRIANLEALKLDEAIFSNAVFLSLTDFSIPLLPQPKGRSNPFAPIGAEEENSFIGE